MNQHSKLFQRTAAQSVTFCALLPRSSLPPKQIDTSDRRLCAGLSTATVKLSTRFWRASERGSNSGSCDPV